MTNAQAEMTNEATCLFIGHFGLDIGHCPTLDPRALPLAKPWAWWGVQLPAEQEVTHIPVLHDVGLAFDTHLAGLADGFFALVLL